MKKLLAMILCAAMILSFCTVMASADETVDFPDVYPESALYKISDEEVSAKVEALLATMTEEEMYSLLGGARAANSRYGYGTGYLAGVARLGVPVVRMWDGPMGVIGNNIMQTNSPAQELSLGSSWDPDLAYQYGVLVATENRATAANMQLGTQFDVSRDMSTGRTRDTLSEDPYLSAIVGDAQAKAYEDNFVTAVLKHFGCYSSYSTNRNCIVDEQTMHEVWFTPFEYIIKNNHGHAVMSSYSTINGQYASANHYMEITVLRDMWGFDGISMTDWGGNHEMTVGLGTDLEMGSLNRNRQANVEAAIAEGKITYEDDVKTCVRHTLTCMGALGYLNLVKVADGKALADPEPPATIEMPVMEEGSAERVALLDSNVDIALQTALGGAVLLKNEGKALPLGKDDSIAVIGIGGERAVTGHYSEASFGYLAPWSGLSYELSAAGYNVTKAVGTNNIFGHDIPAEWLYTDAEATTHGVTYTKTVGEETTTFVKDNIELTTNSKNYKNAEDGDALVLGENVAVKTYLKVPESGTYGFKFLNMGVSQQKTVTIGEIGAERPTSLAASGGGWGRSSAGGFGKSGVTITETGMDIPASFTNVELEAGKVYEINITTGVANQYKDAQFKIVYQTEGTVAADEQAMLDAAASCKKVVFMGYAKNTTNKGLDNVQNEMLAKVMETAKANGNQVIVVLETASPFVMSFKDDADAIVEMWLAGETAAQAEQKLLTGEVNFSGKLSIAVPGSVEDAQESNPDWNTTGYLEGIYVGYKYYDKYDIPTQFDFGYGLSYTTFEYSDLKVEEADGGYDVTFTVKNTGDVKGSEIAQVYVGEAQVPATVQMAKYALAGFQKIKDLEPGEAREVTIRVNERQLSYWYTDKEVEEGEEKWTLATGERTIYVGAASDDLRLSETVYVNADDISGTNGEGKCGEGETATVDFIYNGKDTVTSVRAAIDSQFDIVEVTSEHDFEFNPDNGKVVVYNDEFHAGDVLFSVTVSLDVEPWLADGAYPVNISLIEATDEDGALIELGTMPGYVVIKNEYPKGDITRDGKVDNADLIMIARYLVDLEQFDAQQKEIADFNDDGEIDNTDLVLIAKEVAKA